MQAPVQDAGNHHIARQARAMQEEQQRDGAVRRIAEDRRELSLCGRREAMMTVATSSRVKVSGRKRRMISSIRKTRFTDE